MKIGFQIQHVQDDAVGIWISRSGSSAECWVCVKVKVAVIRAGCTFFLAQLTTTMCGLIMVHYFHGAFVENALLLRLLCKHSVRTEHHCSLC